MTGTLEGGRERDAYFDEQWRMAEEARKKRAEARRRAWWRWEKEHQHEAPYSPWLVIPSSLNDYGVRPLAPGTPHWASPFVWVESPDPSGKALAGAENFLWARIFNLGAATAAPTKVDFYWADPSIGLGAADANYVGTEWVEVQPMNSTVVRCSTPWIPSYVNNGHECTFVNSHNHVLDPITAPFQAWADRHVGQRNLAVLPANQQVFSIWAPMALPQFPAEIRILALRAKATGGFQPQKTPDLTLTLAAHEVIRGLRRVPETARRKLDQPMQPPVFAQPLAMERVVRGVRALHEKRTFHPTADVKDRARAGGIDGAELGELALRIPDGHGALVRLEVELRELDLGLHEIVIVNIAHVAAGTVTGGYTLVLADGAWFRDSPIWAEEGGNMAKKKGNGLERIVIEHNAEARITHQVALQLVDHLPIASLEKLTAMVSDIVVENHRIPLAVFAPFIAEEIFPIDREEDLVRKLSAATRMAIAMAKEGTIRNPTVNALLAGLGAEPDRRPAIPAGHFSGPSIYGSKRAKGE